jgi:hemoglobin
MCYIIIVDTGDEFSIMPESFYELAGGAEGMERLASAFYRYVFDDPLMLPLFHDPNEDHVGRMALWLGEFFGGPARHSKQRGGFQTLVAVHEPLNISDAQRDRWINYMMAACEEVNLPEEVVNYFTPFIYSGARAAQRNSRFR